MKSIFSLRNIAIAICILVIIIVVVILIFEPDFNKNAEQQATIASTSQNDSNIPQNNQEPVPTALSGLSHFFQVPLKVIIRRLDVR